MRFAAILVLALLFCAPVHGAAEREQVQFFETRIRPLLAEHCFECHGEKKQKGNLRLDSAAAFASGGDLGPVAVGGAPEKSLIIKATSHTDDDLRMPPKKKLSDRQIADLTAWVKGGAIYPGAAADAAIQPRKSGFTVTDEDRAYWAYRPIARPAAPTIANRNSQITNSIDAFLVAKLREKGIEPNPLADRRVLIRRAFFDLIGLPPTPEEVEAFVNDASPGAYERLLDGLLARPQYGERWGRHWLDLVRFAETNGYERDGVKPEAWRYRDYVIRSFNADKPYDRFVIEQLAGDEVEDASDESIIATGFYRLHVWDDEPDSTLVAEYDDLDDIMVTASGTFLGLTIGCARCHDHKFDPISQADYYKTLAYFRGINPYGLHHKGGGSRPTGKITKALGPAEEIAKWEASRRARIEALRHRLAGEKDESKKKQLDGEIRKVEQESPPYGMALTVSEDEAKPTHILIRGNPETPGAEVSPAFLEVLSHLSSIKNQKSKIENSKRMALARWIASKENPLTARVMVNRLWQHHFGTGIVKTPSDFGRTGTPPTHPELLDYLASEFINGGWRIKRMHKLIMMSHAYRMSSRVSNPAAMKVDEGNDLLWRHNLRRVEAEVVRDTILSAAGTLNLKPFGPGVFVNLPKEVHVTQDSSGKGWGKSEEAEQNRRSIYIFVKRALLVPLLDVFDYNTVSSPAPARPVTTVSPQALMLLNDDFVQKQAQALARRLEREAGEDRRRQIRRAFALVVQRSPTEREMELSLAALAEQETLAGGDAQSRIRAMKNFCVSMLNLNEMIYVD